MAVTLEDIKNADRRIRPYVRKTPVQPLELSRGKTVYLKLENLQTTKAFKLRGASNCLLQLTEAQKAAGVVTASSGNHGQGMALAASRLGIRATVCMPADAPHAKVDAARGFGAIVELIPGGYNAAVERVHEIEHATGAFYVPAFDDDRIIAGQGTIGLELMEQLPKLSQIVVPIGGGGMISGIATAAKALNPAVKIIGVQPETAAVMYESVRQHKLVYIEDSHSIADGVVAKKIADRTLHYCEQIVDEIVTVSEEQIKEAVLYLFEHAAVVAEPAAALSTAAVLNGKVNVTDTENPTVCIVSGGNIDASFMASIIEELKGEE